MKCPNCNVTIRQEEAQFCHVCGTRLVDDDAEQPKPSGTQTGSLPPVRTFTVNGVSFNMVLVEGGEFWMGEQREDPSKPNFDPEANGNSVKRESVDSFYIGETVATIGLVDAVFPYQKLTDMYRYHRELNGLRWADGEEEEQNMLPAFACFDLSLLCSELMAQTGCYFRFLTEKEWEYAARGGNKSKGFRFAGSNILKEVGWYYGNCYSIINGVRTNTLHIVKQKKPNELGLYDMSGLVDEFCYDGIKAMLRGGNVCSFPSQCRVSSRTSRIDNDRRYGLRLAMIP